MKDVGLLTLLLLGMAGLCGVFFFFCKKEKRAARYSAQEEIQWYIRDKAVPVQSNTAQRDVNVPLEEKLAQTGLDSPPPSPIQTVVVPA